MQNQTDLVKFDKLKADITLFVEPIKSLKIVDQESGVEIHRVGKEVKDWYKRVETRRKELVDPHNQTVKQINAYAKEIVKPLLEAESHIKRELADWEAKMAKIRQDQLRMAEEERRRAEEEARAKLEAQKSQSSLRDRFKSSDDKKREEIVAGVEAERAQAEITAQHKEVVREIESTKISGARKIWKFDVTEPNRVPPEYWMIDEKKIREAVRSGVREISGVRIYDEISYAL